MELVGPPFRVRLIPPTGFSALRPKPSGGGPWRCPRLRYQRPFRARLTRRKSKRRRRVPQKRNSALPRTVG